MEAPSNKSSSRKKHKKRSHTSGDDLDDNLAVAFDDEKNEHEDGGDDEPKEIVLGEDVNDSPAPGHFTTSAAQSSSSETASKKRQKFEILKAKKKGTPKQKPSDVRYHSAVEQANHLWLKFLDTHHGELSSLELKEIITEEHFQEFTIENREASTINVALQELPESALFGEAIKDGEEVGAPLLLIVSPSAESAASIAEALRTPPTPCEAKSIAKLFGRRVKPESQAAFLKNPVRLAVGTPHRLQKLVEMGALSMSKLKYLVLDMSRNVKQVNILDMADTKKEFNTFFKAFLLDRVKKGETKIVFF